MRTTSLLANKMYADREKTGDITFIVGSESIKAHKSVLAALSPKYKAQFYASQQPEDDEVLIENVSQAAFKEFIKYCYVEDCDFSTDIIEGLLDLAKQSFLNHLVSKCGLFLIDKIKMNNICWMYRLALLYDLNAVRDLCDYRVNAHLPELFKTDDFLGCDREVLQHIVNIKALNCAEVNIFEGCIAWAKSECQRNDIDDSNSANMRAALGSTINHIRFRSMEIKEFVQLDQKYKGFFSPEEFHEITVVIVDAENFQSHTINQTKREKAVVAADESDDDY